MELKYKSKQVLTTMWWAQCLLLVTVTYLVDSRDVEVTTSYGKILGTTLTSRLGKTIYAFRGIRYAKAPVDELRFKPPVPVKKWSGIYNATADAAVCPQPGIGPVSEDCLFLNVYTTKLPNSRHNPNRPVIVHLHAGAFYSVTGRSNWAGPQYFMDQDIILVTFNYRLGSLGFISVGREAPGNNGLKDQVVAMKWVKNNIEAFGGDPNSITLFGYSAGAWSISLHMVSPMSRGLFHKAILGSGSALGIWPLPKNQLDLAKKQARIVGCPQNNSTEILKCLKTKSAEELGNSLPQFAEFGSTLLLTWSPVIEEDFGQERFLAENPIELYKRGQFENIPIIGGVTKDEFGYMAINVVNNDTLLNELSDNFEKWAPITFIYERGTPRSREVSQSIRKFYLGDGPLTKQSLDALAKIYADAVVGFPTYRAVDLIARKSSKPVYFYKFTYQGRYSHYYLPESNGTVPYGVVHHDDLIYLFYISPLFPFFNSSFPEKEMVETLTSLWATFARTGDPTHVSKRHCGDTEWVPYNSHTKKYLDIGKQLVLKENMFGERYSFWEKLYPL